MRPRMRVSEVDGRGDLRFQGAPSARKGATALTNPRLARGTARRISRRTSPAWHRSTHQHRLEGAGIAPLVTIGAAVAHRVVDIGTLAAVGSCPFDLPTL